MNLEGFPNTKAIIKSGSNIVHYHLVLDYAVPVGERNYRIKKGEWIFSSTIDAQDT